MALRSNFYIKLVINDIVSDEKLNACSSSANGIYLRLICFLHRQTEYGVFILKEQELIDNDLIKCFSKRLKKHMPFTFDEIYKGISELKEFDVIQIRENRLEQKRMIKDSKEYEKFSERGKKGMESRYKKFGIDPGKIDVSNKQEEKEEKQEEKKTFPPKNTAAPFDEKLAGIKFTFYSGNEKKSWLESVAMSQRIDMKPLLVLLYDFCVEKNNSGLLATMDDQYFTTAFNKFLKIQKDNKLKKETPTTSTFKVKS